MFSRCGSKTPISVGRGAPFPRDVELCKAVFHTQSTRILDSYFRKLEPDQPVDTTSW